MATKKGASTKQDSSEKKRRKAVRKDKVILIRATEAQKEVLAEAAESDGRSLSAWMLWVSLREAQKVKRTMERDI